MRIVLATDLSEPSLLAVDALCSCGPMPFEHVTLVHVIDLDLYTAGGSIPQIHDWAAKQLAEQVERLRDCGMNVTARVEQGDSVEQIEAVVAEEGADLIMVTSLGKGAVSGRLFGSTAEKLAAAARVPVLVERVALQGQQWCRLGDAPFSKVLLATEVDEQLPAAFEFIRQLPGLAHLRVVNVAVDEQAARLAEPLVAALQASDLEVESAVLLGDPVEMLIADIAQWQPTLVCVTPKARGFERVLKGSVSTQIVAGTEAAVLFMPTIR